MAQKKLETPSTARVPCTAAITKLGLLACSGLRFFGPADLTKAAKINLTHRANPTVIKEIVRQLGERYGKGTMSNQPCSRFAMFAEIDLSNVMIHDFSSYGSLQGSEQ